MSDCKYWPQYSPDGGVQWLLPKLWTSSIRGCVWYHTGTPLWPLKWPAKLVYFFCRFICCCPGSRWGNTERVVAQWWQPVACRVALDMSHWAMPPVLLWRTATAIKMANNEGAFVCQCRLFCMIIRSYKTMLWTLKLNSSCNINLKRFISLFVWYLPVPATMDSIFATNVASRWAQFKNTHRLV